MKYRFRRYVEGATSYVTAWELFEEFEAEDDEARVKWETLVASATSNDEFECQWLTPEGAWHTKAAIANEEDRNRLRIEQARLKPMMVIPDNPDYFEGVWTSDRIGEGMSDEEVDAHMSHVMKSMMEDDLVSSPLLTYLQNNPYEPAPLPPKTLKQRMRDGWRWFKGKMPVLITRSRLEYLETYSDY